MVHIARNQLPMAIEVLRQGVALQDRQAGRESRYPASGLHWLLGLVLLAQGDADRALASSAANSTPPRVRRRASGARSSR